MHLQSWCRILVLTFKMNERDLENFLFNKYKLYPSGETTFIACSVLVERERERWLFLCSRQFFGG